MRITQLLLKAKDDEVKLIKHFYIFNIYNTIEKTVDNSQKSPYTISSGEDGHIYRYVVKAQ